jgi:hypothetical protein
MQPDESQKFGFTLRPGATFLRRPEQEHSQNRKVGYNPAGLKAFERKRLMWQGHVSIKKVAPLTVQGYEGRAQHEGGRTASRGGPPAPFLLVHQNGGPQSWLQHRLGLERAEVGLAAQGPPMARPDVLGVRPE